MSNDEQEVKCASNLWVGLWHERRHVVFDPTIQPQDEAFILLYFVEGQCLCYRDRTADRSKVITVRDPFAIQFAIRQYGFWRQKNPDRIKSLAVTPLCEVQDPEPLNVKCPVCSGEAIWHERAGAFSNGTGIADGENTRTACNRCMGKGVISNLIYDLPLHEDQIKNLSGGY